MWLPANSFSDQKMSENALLRKIKIANNHPRKIKLSNKEIESTTKLLEVEDVKLRFSVGELLLHQGPRSIPALLKAVYNQNPQVRRSSVYLLGKLAKKGRGVLAPPIIPALHQALRDGDPKVRKNSAVVLGSLGVGESTAKLISALESEPVTWVRPSLILALGAVGGDPAKSYLTSYQTQSELEAEALDKALDRVSKTPSNLRFVRCSPKPLLVELWTFKGLESILKSDLKEKLGLESKVAEEGILQLRTKNLHHLFSVRTFSELLVPIATASITSTETVPTKIIELIQNSNTVNKLLRLHEDNPNHIRYRLEIRSAYLKHYLRKEIIRELTRALKGFAPAFINRPSNYDVEIRLVMKNGKLRLLWKPYTIPDTRFSYRIQDIPAAISPVVGAGVVSFLKPKSTRRHRVLDPFCGSGTILIERAIAGECKELVGIDISKRAVSAAQQNVETSGFKNIKLINNDMRKVSYCKKFDEVGA